MDFSGATISVSALPQPGNDQELHFTGEIPVKNQAVQFDNNGNLLFFIVDGNIYDADGYVIALNEDEPSELDVNEFPAMLNDIAITNVPGYCDKFYLFSTCHKASNSASFQVVCTILDMAVQNPNFADDQNRKGALMTAVISEEIYSDDFFYFFSGDFNMQGEHSIIMIDGGSDVGEKTNVNSLEIVELDSSKKILLAGSRIDGVMGFLLEQESITEIVDCYNANGGSGAGDYYSSIEAVQLSSDSFMMACHTYACNSSSSSGTSAYTAYFDENGFTSELTEHVVPSISNGLVTSLEFSPSGDFLWLTMDVDPYIAVVDVVNSVVLTPISGDLSAYAYSELESQVDEEGADVIYVATGTGLKKILNPDSPNTSSIVDVAWEDGIAANSYPGDSDGSPIIYTLQGQNTNAPTLQSFLAAAECCHEYAEFHFGEVPIISTSNDGTWTDGDNPFENQSSPVRITSDLIFPTGTVTTINDMVFEFDEDANVIIEKGARVSLNGTTWTALTCGSMMWPGVDVLGTTNAESSIDQLPMSGGDQGFLYLNNSTIEHAIRGVEVGTADFNSGGIIRAFGSTFRNNREDVIFRRYHFINSGGNYVQNKSLFTNCNFVTDAHLNHPNIGPRDHVRLIEVDKIQFSDCSFMNTTDLSTYNWLERGRGIYSMRASFSVNGSNDPWTGSPLDTDQTTFYKLRYGISSYGYNNPLAFYTCKQQEFQQCLYGIVNYNTDNAIIHQNNFQLPDAAGSSSDETTERGIYLTNSTGFVVEQNSFYGYDDIAVNEDYPCALGLWVDNSGDYANLIYNNDFDNLKLGIYVTGENEDFIAEVDGIVDETIDDQTGLQLICNTFTNDQTDIYRGAETSMRWVQAGNQGNPANELGPFILAGNRFSADDCNGAISDFVCDPYNDQHLDYWCHADLNTIPDCGGISNYPGFEGMELLTVSVSVLEFSDEDCPNRYPSGDGKGPGDISGLMSQLSIFGQELDESKATYTLVVDDNQKQNTLNTLDEAFPHESQFYRDLLIQRFPLSDEVLLKLIEQAARLNSWHLTEVFLANSPLPREILFHIEQAEILSDFFMTFLYDADSGASLRRLLELNMLGLATERDLLIQDIAQSGLTYESDSESDSDALLYVNDYLNQLAMQSGSTSLRILAASLESQGDYGAAVALIENDPVLESYATILNMKQGVNGDWSLLGAPEFALLWEIYNSQQDFSSSTAFAILTEIGEADFEPEPSVPIQYRSMKLDDVSEPHKQPLLGIWPNPASDVAWLHYPFEADEYATINVFDQQGRRMVSFQPNAKGLVELSLREYESGIYVVQLIALEKVIETVKFTVIK